MRAASRKTTAISGTARPALPKPTAKNSPLPMWPRTRPIGSRRRAHPPSAIALTSSWVRAKVQMYAGSADLHVAAGDGIALSEG